MNSSYFIEKCKSLLLEKNQIILYGPPGTGKTYYANLISTQSSSLLFDAIKNSADWLLLFINDITWKEISQKNSLMSVNYSNFLPFTNISNIPILFFVGGIKTDYKRITAIGLCNQIDFQQKSLNIDFLNTIKGPKDTTIKDEISDLRNTIDYSENKITVIKKEQGHKILTMSNWVQKTSFLTFHQSYSYEEFIEGIRPVINEKGDLSYQVKSGVFKELCQLACNSLLEDVGFNQKEWIDGEDVPEFSSKDQEKIWNRAPNVPYYLIIDEINRGDISRIFGELITLLERDKRLFNPNALINSVILPYSRKKFGIPPNLYIIGTMNSTDKSIALIDIALRRRFGFVELMPDVNILNEKFELSKLNKTDSINENQDVYQTASNLLTTLNIWIIKHLDRDHQIGHSFFLGLKNNEKNQREMIINRFEKIWYYDVIPLLQEYLYNSPEDLQRAIGDAFIEKDTATILEITGEDFLEKIKEHITKLNT